MDSDMLEMIRGMIQAEIKKAMYSDDDMFAEEGEDMGCEYCEGEGCPHCEAEMMELEEEAEPTLSISIIPLGKKKEEESEEDYEM